jgi:phage portal protein BeeE
VADDVGSARRPEFVASQQLSATQVATLFHLPPAYLGGSTGDSLTYATVESNQIQFAQLAIAPVTNTIAKALSSDLTIFPFNAWYPEFVLEGLMRGDHAARAAFYQTMFGLVDEKGRRALDVDEIRARENLKPAVTPAAPPVRCALTDG